LRSTGEQDHGKEKETKTEAETETLLINGDAQSRIETSFLCRVSGASGRNRLVGIQFTIVDTA
tara:strand:+ start:84 stop:272 length:189 start_codon:yes stop_codon:yes gene_type:complete